MCSTPANAGKPALDVAIIGGGITGLALALGLQARGIKYKIYERSSAFHEIGAGLGFSPNAERAMRELAPALHAAFKRVANANGEDYFQWINGCPSEGDETYHGSPAGDLIYKLYVGQDMFQGCRRSDYVDELAKLVPPGNVEFGRQADRLFEDADGRPNVVFRDGESAAADIVIGCDGIHSRVRQLMLGEDNRASNPGYTHKYCFRALVGTGEAREAIGEGGEYATSTRFMYNGPGGHLMTYPVGNGTLLNVLAVVSDPDEWTHPKHTVKTSKAEVKFFDRWSHPVVKGLLSLFPDELEKWAIFDHLDHAAPRYDKGCVGIAGDAAHAAGPHLGAGAGFGIEDALALAVAIDRVNKECVPSNRVALCRKALAAYSSARYDRTQWLIGATRDACSLFQDDRRFAVRENDVFGTKISELFHEVWDYDVSQMVKEVEREVDVQGDV